MTIETTTIDRMVALIRRMSALPNPDRAYIEAREINALLPPPLDPDQDEVDAYIQANPNLNLSPEAGLAILKIGRSLERSDLGQL